MELGAVDDACNDFLDIVRNSSIAWNDAAKLARRELGLDRLTKLNVRRRILGAIERCDNVTSDRQSVCIIVRKVIRDTTASHAR